MFRLKLRALLLPSLHCRGQFLLIVRAVDSLVSSHVCHVLQIVNYELRITNHTFLLKSCSYNDLTSVNFVHGSWSFFSIYMLTIPVIYEFMICDHDIKLGDCESTQIGSVSANDLSGANLHASD